MEDLEILLKMESAGDMSVQRQDARAKWGAVSAVPQQREDRLPMENASAKWMQIYELFSASSESSRDEVFAAVTLYFLANGCSPSGRYARDVRTGGGVAVPIDSVVKVIGKLEGEIRQFMRSDMKKSYECLKWSPAVSGDRALADRAEILGVPRDKSFLLADWISRCEYMTGEESAIHQALSRRLIDDANRRRQLPVATHRVDDEVLPVPEGSRGTPGNSAQGADYSTY